jgi:nitrite reductase (cytochrome c-552)
MRNRSTLILGALVIILAGALIAVLITVSNQAPAYRGIEPRDDVDIQPPEPDPTIWGRNYPPVRHLAEDAGADRDGLWRLGSRQARARPRLKQLFAGYAFSKAYNEERGHYWSVTDVSTTGRNPTACTCWTCKSAVVPGLMQQLTPAGFYTSTFETSPSLQRRQADLVRRLPRQRDMELVITGPPSERRWKRRAST